MIKSFGDAQTREFWESGKSRNAPPANLRSAAKRKLQMVDSATKLDDLRVPPGNQLHALKADRHGQHAIRINDQYRVCFTWKDSDAHDVEITDYH